ncbi:MAG: hypothetical protein AAGD12_03060 [Pseudomonadota bacterium]
MSGPGSTSGAHSGPAPDAKSGRAVWTAERAAEGAEEVARWAPHPQPGERLLWSGRPDRAVYVRAVHVLGVHVRGVHVPLARLVLAVVLPFATLYAIRVFISVGWDPSNALLGLIIALSTALWIPGTMRDLLRRRISRYALTDRRALRHWPIVGPTLSSRRISPTSGVALDEADCDTLHITDLRAGFTAFERIDHGRALMRLVMDVEAGRA